MEINFKHNNKYYCSMHNWDTDYVGIFEFTLVGVEKILLKQYSYEYLASVNEDGWDFLELAKILFLKEKQFEEEMSYIINDID